MLEPPRKRHTTEFKLQVIREVEQGKTIAQAARDNNVHPTTITRWRKQYGQGNLIFHTTSHVHGIKDILLVAISVAIALGSILFIERFIVLTHELLGSEKGILSLETVVVSVLTGAFVGNEVKRHITDMLTKSEMPGERRTPSLQESLSLLLSVAVSAGIYKAYNL